MKPLIRSVIDGLNVCIFEYGQTGSGKTFTMVMNCTKKILFPYVLITFSKLFKPLYEFCAEWTESFDRGKPRC